MKHSPVSEASTIQSVLVILPTYNEAANVGELIPAILDKAGPYGARVLVVDDHSADGTADIVRGLMETDDRILLHERPGKLGLGTAYVAGFRRALDEQADLAVTMDADFSHNPDHLPALIEAARHGDIAIGSRYVQGGGISNWPFYRKLLSSGANLLARTILGVRSRDCTSGYRAYRRAYLEQIDWDAIHSDGYSFLIELLTVCERRGAVIRETPIQFVDRRGGDSKISKAEIFKAFGTLWRLAWRVRG